MTSQKIAMPHESSNADELLDVIASRHSKRAYLDKEVQKEVLEAVLVTAQNAPSSKNTQPWKVAVVSGEKRNELSLAMCKAFDAGEKGKAEYQYMMNPVDDLFMERARDCGYKLFELKGIARIDKPARLAHARENFTFFNAPALMIFHLPDNAQPGMFLDMGLFMQSVMLGLKACGLDSCPQFAIAQYPGIIREVLNLGADRLIVCGLSLGYADNGAPVNSYVPTRAPLGEVVDWFE